MPPKAVSASIGTLRVIVSMPDFMTAVPVIMRRTFFAVSGERAGERGAGSAAGDRKGASKFAGAARTSGRRERASPVRREKLSEAAWGAAETGIFSSEPVRACAASTREGKDRG